MNDEPQVMEAAVDLRTSDRLMEEALAADFLNDSQRRNARLKSRDLLEERSEWESVPFRLMIEPNRNCNARCVHCDIERTGTGNLSLAVVERLLDEVGWGSMEIMPFIGGEPTLAPIDSLAPLARRHNNYFNFITNGLRFTGDYYRRIADCTARVHFSFHSHRREAHERIMPGLSYDVIVQNMRDAADIGRDSGAQILAGLVVMEENLEDLAEYVRFVHGLGIRRVVFQKLYPWTKVYGLQGVEGRRSPDEIAEHAGRALETALELGVFLEGNVDAVFGDPRNQNPWTSRFDVLQSNAHVVQLFHPGFCISTAITVLVEWDGTVLPCCRDRIVLGNLNEQSFGEIWNGDAMKRLRESFFRRRLSSFCAKCMAFYNGHA